MTNLLIDTCVWLEIAKTTKGEKILSLLEEFIEEDEVSLIVPEIVIEEFERNKDRIVVDAGKSLSSHFEKVKEIFIKHGGEKDKEVVLAQLNDLNHKIPTLGETVSSSLQRIEKLFSQCEIIKMTDEIKLRAVQRAIDKKAPFHLSKNSIGDAIIIESFIEYAIQNDSQNFKLVFVTENKKDFSLQNGNHKLPHEDLAEHFDSNKSFYFISLPEALHAINPELIENFELENDWKTEPRQLSEILSIERELEHKIWYNRHKIYEARIFSGEIKIIRREDYDIMKSRFTVVDEIWLGAKKSAKAIEDEFGEENLMWDDFEWGMLNGKLSALRWVNGDEWDFLDT